MISSRRFTARRRYHSDFPTTVHTLSSSPSPSYHYLLLLLTTRLTTITSAHRHCRCLCLCLCLSVLFTSRCSSLLERTIRSTFLTRPTPLSLDQPLRGITLSRPAVVVNPILLLLVSKTLTSVLCLLVCVCLGWLGSEPSMLQWSLCPVRDDSLCCDMNHLAQCS